MLELQEGETVVIYADPITKVNREGEAELLEEYRPDEGDGLSMWVVRFLTDDFKCVRTIYAPQ